jgi:hypothetical protein
MSKQNIADARAGGNRKRSIPAPLETPPSGAEGGLVQGLPHTGRGGPDGQPRSGQLVPGENTQNDGRLGKPFAGGKDRRVTGGKNSETSQ